MYKYKVDYNSHPSLYTELHDNSLDFCNDITKIKCHLCQLLKISIEPMVILVPKPHNVHRFTV